MNKIDNNYAFILKEILNKGYDYEDPNRKGVFRKELTNVCIDHSAFSGFPIVSLRKTFFKGAVGELLLFLKGKNDIRDYWDYGIKFWDKDWARFNNHSKDSIENLRHIYKTEAKNNPCLNELYTMGEIYPKQYVKQYHVFDNFKKQPLRTDLIVDSWQVGDLENMALIPCHFGFQIVGSTEGFEIVWFQRSTDFMLGTPINIQYYFLMGMLLSEWSGHKFNGVRAILNKCHLYDNQYGLAQKIVDTSEKNLEYTQPKVTLDIKEEYKSLSFSEFIKKIEPSDFKLENYIYHLDDSVEMLTYK